MPIDKSPVVFQESALAHQILDGLEGLEIGPAAHNPFGLRTRNVGLSAEQDPIDHEFFKQSQLEHCGQIAPIHIAADAADIPLAESSTDFVLHSHVWEHLPQPLLALEEWVRVTRSGGYIFAIVPKRDAAVTDIDRPVTTLETLVKAYDRNAKRADCARTAPGASRGHYTVFSLGLLHSIGNWYNASHLRTKLDQVAIQETDDKVGNGHTIVWQVKKFRGPIGLIPAALSRIKFWQTRTTQSKAE